MTWQRRNYDVLYSALVSAQSSRRHFPGVEWIDFERLVMLACVNRIRFVDDRFKDDPRPLFTLDQIKAVESQAAGHIDYTKKFALGCAELLD